MKLNFIQIGVMVILVFALFIIMYSVLKVRKQNLFNDSQPKLSVLATVVSKREYIKHNAGYYSKDTFYFITFRFDTGSLHEITLDTTDYDKIQKGDQGMLTFQGNRFIGFERNDKI